MSHLPQRLLEMTSELTRLCRLDGLACPPVPPQPFLLRLVCHKLVEIERALRLEHLYLLPPKETHLISEKIYDYTVRIHWCILGRPPPHTTGFLHAAEQNLTRLNAALSM